MRPGGGGQEVELKHKSEQCIQSDCEGFQSGRTNIIERYKTIDRYCSIIQTHELFNSVT